MSEITIKENLQQRLKSISTYEEFIELQKEMEENNFAFFGKRRDILITGFSQ